MIAAPMPNSPSLLPETDLSEQGSVATETAQDRLLVRFAGRWDWQTAMDTEQDRASIEAVGGEGAILDLSNVTLLDTVGALAVWRLKVKLERSGPVELAGVGEAEGALLGQIKQVESVPLTQAKPISLIDRVTILGERTVAIGREARQLISFYGELIVVYMRLLRHPGRIRLTSMIHHMQSVGLDAMPIVGLLAFLVGVVLTFISGDQLQKFGATIFIVNLIGFGVLRELGILITAIIVAGRSGSAFTAEIGTMKINQEVDAMRTIGLDPMEVLVVPRATALILILIPLGFFADIVMIGGGALMANLSLGITFPQFLAQFQASITLQNFWVGVLKTPFFAFVIAMVGCYHGLEVAGSAESVGQHTTQSVVQSIFLVIALDAIFAVVFWQLGW
jgi:phospholipid/cholesterol/gamma-HCH transport system permease protein